jgi:pimeloyl-ACP methyl ester carboxylesterase
MTATLPTTPVEPDRHLTLAGGRQLSFATFGPADGTPVVVLDGPGSRGLVRAAAPVATELGLRLVAPDRPGFFGSTPVAHRRIVDWPADHAALLDELGIERAGILGQSGGTPYSLAVAAALPERVVSIALLGAVAPMYEREAKRTAGKQLRMATTLGRRAPWLLRAGLRRQDADKAARDAVAELPRVDKAMMEDPRFWGLHLQATREILGKPEAVVHEFGLLARRWGIDPADVRAPVAFWTGAEDPVHPAPHAHRLARALGDASVTIVPEAASFGLYPRYADALRFAAGR